jgi:DNA-binding XRE family transcriptional regulator
MRTGSGEAEQASTEFRTLAASAAISSRARDVNVFGAKLRFYRTRAGLPQKDLAALVHVSNDVISKIETGERPPAEDFPPTSTRYPSWTPEAP